MTMNKSSNLRLIDYTSNLKRLKNRRKHLIYQPFFVPDRHYSACRQFLRIDERLCRMLVRICGARKTSWTVQVTFRFLRTDMMVSPLKLLNTIHSGSYQ